MGRVSGAPLKHPMDVEPLPFLCLLIAVTPVLVLCTPEDEVECPLSIIYCPNYYGMASSRLSPVYYPEFISLQHSTPCHLGNP